MPARTIHLSAHAVERSDQRARRALDAAEALDELTLLVRGAEVVDTPPSWYAQCRVRWESSDDVRCRRRVRGRTRRTVEAAV